MAPVELKWVYQLEVDLVRPSSPFTAKEENVEGSSRNSPPCNIAEAEEPRVIGAQNVSPTLENLSDMAPVPCTSAEEEGKAEGPSETEHNFQTDVPYGGGDANHTVLHESISSSSSEMRDDKIEIESAQD